ncbi:MAG TPA: transposase [Candidatus Methylomirabilis sp.]|nr:transposase [Candidatus Methylomirabilis sp.]
MGRPPRIHFPGALYHVIARGNHGQEIFRSDADRQRLLVSLEQVWRQYPFELYAFVLMPNHVHLLIQVQDVPLAKIMQSLLYRHSAYFNKTYTQRGHLFQGRYRAILCDREPYLLELVRYIHLNPVRAGLVATPDRYRWSSHVAYLGRESWPFLGLSPVLGQFADRVGIARTRYHRFVAAGIDQGQRPDLYAITDGRFLGDDTFVTAVRRPKRPVAELSLPVHIASGELTAAVTRCFDVSLVRLPGSEKTREVVMARRVVALLAVEVGGYSQREAASILACHPASVSQGIKRLRECLQGDSALAEQVSALRRELRRARPIRWQKSATHRQSINKVPGT